MTKDKKLYHKSTVTGVGDDVPCLHTVEISAVTTDLLMEDVHFDFVCF